MPLKSRNCGFSSFCYPRAKRRGSRHIGRCTVEVYCLDLAVFLASVIFT